MIFSNIFKKNSPDEKSAKRNQKRLEDMVDFLDTEAEKDMKIIETHSSGWEEAQKDLELIRKIHSKIKGV